MRLSVFRRAVPEAVRALAPGERRLAWAVAEDGTPLVLTPVGLHLGDRTLPWTSIARAEFTPPVLSVQEVDEVDGQGARHEIALAQDSGLAQLVRAHVSASVAWSDVRRLEPRGKVRLVARRQPGTDALLWQTVWLEGTDRHDPALRAQAEALVGALRASLG
jgi:hypothetical protein